MHSQLITLNCSEVFPVGVFDLGFDADSVGGLGVGAGGSVGGRRGRLSMDFLESDIFAHIGIDFLSLARRLRFAGTAVCRTGAGGCAVENVVHALLRATVGAAYTPELPQPADEGYDDEEQEQE